MKVAISGSAGVGKTTFAIALAERCGCRLIAEGYDSLFGPDARFLPSRTRLRHEILAVLERKNALEDEAPAFVADRCAVDLFNLWMSRGFGDDEKMTGCLYQRCRRYMVKYDFVFVLPWSASPLRQIVAPVNRRRSLNPWFQLYSQANVIGLLHQWLPPGRLIPIPYGMSDLHERVAFACEMIDGGG